MGRKKGKMRTVTVVVTIIAIVVGAYLVLALPTQLVNQTHTVNSLGGNDPYSFTVGFPKSSIRVVFTVQGTAGGYNIKILNSTNGEIWSSGAQVVPSSTTTTQYAWIPASGSYTIRVEYLLVQMSYTLVVEAKGAPW